MNSYEQEIATLKKRVASLEEAKRYLNRDIDSLTDTVEFVVENTDIDPDDLAGAVRIFERKAQLKMDLKAKGGQA